ncbi:hypothetical protein ACJ41O_006533 [Fusarium nematophilum]
MMSRAHTELYEPEAQSAEYVKKLVAKRAVIIGKTKMTQFASSDEPTDQWISTSTALSTVEETSIRVPMAVLQVPQQLLQDTLGWIILSHETRLFDVVGLFSHDLQGLHHLVSVTMDLSNNSTKFPSRILYPLDFFPHSNGKHQTMLDEFVGILEDFLGTKKVEFSLPHALRPVWILT